MKTNKFFLRMVVYGIAGLISMTSLGVAREILKKVSEDLNFPTLTLIYDEQTGEEGLNTRVEAFIDLLRQRRKGVSMVP